MARSRTELSKKFRAILGNSHVYFQPPNGTKIEYPCIIYKLENDESFNADDKRYITYDRYSLKVIDYDPDSQLRNRICDEFEHSSLDRMAVNNNLNHWYMTIYW